MSQCIAFCCRVVQCVVVCCSVLQCVAVCCSGRKRMTEHRNPFSVFSTIKPHLHLAFGDCPKNCSTLQHAATHCSTLQHTATRCNTLQHVATRCNTLQHAATHRNSLQHTTTIGHSWHPPMCPVWPFGYVVWAP